MFRGFGLQLVTCARNHESHSSRMQEKCPETSNECSTPTCFPHALARCFPPSTVLEGFKRTAKMIPSMYWGDSRISSSRRGQCFGTSNTTRMHGCTDPLQITGCINVYVCMYMCVYAYIYIYTHIHVWDVITTHCLGQNMCTHAGACR